VKLTENWKNGDKISLDLPMSVHVRTWEKNKNSVSVDYGPLTFSLKIEEQYIKIDSSKNAIGDSKWQPGADPQKWPSFEILPQSDWNYALVFDAKNPAASFQIIHKDWPADSYPFTNAAVPIELKATGRKLPQWTIDKDGLCGILPRSPVQTDQPVTPITLVPMGAARLRISAFPVAQGQ
jgi:hypothetical protein